MIGDPLAEERLRRARAGDAFAFGELLAPVLDSGFRLAMTMLKDRNAAEDAVQEAALKSWRKLDRFRYGADLRPWFLAIVANEGWETAQQVETGMNNLGVATVVFSDVHTACVWLGVDPAVAVATVNDLRRELRGPVRDREPFA